MPVTITDFVTHDLRFPTSAELDGSDAMNPDPDYSAAVVVLKTDSTELSGHGMTFTIGRGNELCIAGIRSLAELLKGVTVESLMAEPVTLYRKLTGDSQLRCTTNWNIQLLWDRQGKIRSSFLKHQAEDRRQILILP